MSDAEQDRRRQEIEQQVTALLAMAIGNSIPGLGEVMLVGQFLDFIDPYGYNRVITRDALTKIFTDTVTKLQDAQNSAVKCLQGDSSQCGTMNPSLIDAYNKGDDKTKKDIIRGITSWSTPATVFAKYPKTGACHLFIDNADDMEKCQDQDYKNFYINFWDTNYQKYKDGTVNRNKAKFTDEELASLPVHNKIWIWVVVFLILIFLFIKLV